MNTQADVIRRLHTALPQVRDWIKMLLETHADRARPASELRYPRLSACFPLNMLKGAKVVFVDDVPFPPVAKFGLPEFDAMRQMGLDGITFKDTYFLKKGHISEVLHFHELVHVVQWSRLGIDNFLLAYGHGLMSFGYDQSPLEKMAYTLQDSFELGTLPHELVRVIERDTDAIWHQVAPIVEGLSARV